MSPEIVRELTAIEAPQSDASTGSTPVLQAIADSAAGLLGANRVSLFERPEGGTKARVWVQAATPITHGQRKAALRRSLKGITA